MKNRASLRPGPAVTSTAIVTVLAAVLGTSLAPARPATDSGSTRHASGQAAQGDITFREPQRYAVVAQAPRNVRKLYTVGDVLIDPKNPRQQVIIHKITGDSLMVLDHPAARPRRVNVGQPIPGARGRTLAAIVMLTQLRYQFRAVDRVAEEEPVLVSLSGSMAILEREVKGKALGQAPRRRSTPATRGVPQSPSGKLDAGLATQVRVKQVDEDTFVLDAESLEPVLDTVRRLVPDKPSAIIAAFPPNADVRIDMTSPFGDGTLDRRGFTVKNIKVAQALGLQTGDTVLSLNGRAVNSPLNAWWAFQEILIKQRRVSTLRVEIVRGENRVVNEYQIR